ncbi:hypothetical protein [Arenibaculum pallidiluteum]|uniref:hypothetical protein n=1 Tax=Arenibaculum pallidiluteum TaxID=2812559 RepID=UPI001A9779CF|nr:hypothetical protein [Arenibaculum pallidiluteum]
MKFLPILAPVIAVLGLAACSQPAVQAPTAALSQRVSTLSPNPCSDKTASALAGAGVTADQVDSIYYQPIMGGIDQDQLVGYMAWTRLRSQPGHLITDMETDELGSYCRVRTVYTRGGLELAGVPSF